ncbi:MAG: hypothetical protein M3442_14490 [Chloroflexota bacterium]|nr:hypothetical protein [Chloroflexota bacterium]
MTTTMCGRLAGVGFLIEEVLIGYGPDTDDPDTDGVDMLSPLSLCV